MRNARAGKVALTIRFLIRRPAHFGGIPPRTLVYVETRRHFQIPSLSLLHVPRFSICAELERSRRLNLPFTKLRPFRFRSDGAFFFSAGWVILVEDVSC